MEAPPPSPRVASNPNLGPLKVYSLLAGDLRTAQYCRPPECPHHSSRVVGVTCTPDQKWTPPSFFQRLQVCFIEDVGNPINHTRAAGCLFPSDFWRSVQVGLVEVSLKTHIFRRTCLSMSRMFFEWRALEGTLARFGRDPWRQKKRRVSSSWCMKLIGPPQIGRNP